MLRRKKRLPLLFCERAWKPGQLNHPVACAVYLLLLLVLLPRASAQPQDGSSQNSSSSVKPMISITPSQLKPKTVDQSVKNVMLKCGTPKPKDPGVKYVIRLSLQRRLTQERPDIVNPQTLIEAKTVNTYTGDTQLRAIGGLRNWTTFGEVTGREDEEATIGVNITTSGCWDAGLYTCSLRYYSDVDKTTQAQGTSSAYLSVAPSGNEMSVIPSFKKVKVKVGRTINITCSSNVGLPRNEIYKIVWVWKFRDTSTASKQWKDYDGELSDISTPSHPIPEKCFQRTYTRLSRVITDGDSTRDYRCVVRRWESRTQKKDFPAHMVTIPNFKKKGSYSLGRLGTVGIIFGVLAIICASSLGIFFYHRRKKRLQHSEQEMLQRRHDLDEKRKSLAIVVEKRKSLYTGDDKEADQKADKLLAKLVHSAEKKSSPTTTSAGYRLAAGTSASTVDIDIDSSSMADSSSFVEDTSMAESSVADMEMATAINKLA